MYKIADDPTPSGLSRFVVRPFWPLLATMMAGTWVSLPWFVFNAHAVGSPTRFRETLIAAGGFFAFVATAALLLELEARGVIVGPLRAQLGVLGLTALKLGFAYALCILQSRTFALYEYYGGAVRNGMLVLLLASALRGMVIASTPESLAIPLVLALM